MKKRKKPKYVNLSLIGTVVEKTLGMVISLGLLVNLLAFLPIIYSSASIRFLIKFINYYKTKLSDDKHII
ncbi:hypothetical protein HQN88_19785 [Paenibacillus qinlingensis]|nr:hypothetical protein [Paenibacillus qinlingensis]